MVFLDVNRHPPDLDDEAAFDMVMDTAQGAVGSRRSPPGSEVAPTAPGLTGGRGAGGAYGSVISPQRTFALRGRS